MWEMNKALIDQASVDVLIIVVILQLKAVNCHIVALALPELFALAHSPRLIVPHNFLLHLSKCISYLIFFHFALTFIFAGGEHCLFFLHLCLPLLRRLL